MQQSNFTAAQNMPGYVAQMEPTDVANELVKQTSASRTSARNKQTVDYNDLGSGKNLDYNDLAVAGKGTGKPKNVKVNQEVMKRCVDFFKMIRDSSYWMQLLAASNTVAQPTEYKKQLDELEAIDKNCQALKYPNTSAIQVEIMKLLLKIGLQLGANLEMRQKVDEFTNYIEKLMENYDLVNKEVFTQQLTPVEH